MVLQSFNPSVKSSELSSLHHIFQSIQPIHTICNLIGLCPFRFANQTLLKPSRFDWYYFITFIILYSILSVYSIWGIINDEKNDQVISKYIVLAECSIMVTLMFIVIISTFLTRKVLMKSINLLAEIDSIFFQHGFLFGYKRLLKHNYYIVLFVLISLGIRSSLTLLTVNVDLLQQLTLFFAALVKAMAKYYFVVLVKQLQVRFETINRKINSLYKTRVGLVMNSSECEIPDTLFILCRLHYKLDNVVQKVNLAFAVQLLTTIGVSLFNILFQSYYLYYVSAGKSDFVNVAMIACPIVWLCDEIVEIYWLVSACTSTCENANETPTLLHELRNKTFDLKLESHIQTYSLQMLHQNVQFSVLGFFVIDFTLIYSILGAVTTYLVIFIQFDQSASGGASNNTLVFNNNTIT